MKKSGYYLNCTVFLLSAFFVLEALLWSAVGISTNPVKWSGEDPYYANPPSQAKLGLVVEGPLNTDGDAFIEIAFVSTRVPGQGGGLILNVMEEPLTSHTGPTWSVGPLWSNVEVADLAVGDFNGDGYSDIAVSNPLYATSGCADVGMIEIYFGGGQGLGSGGAITLIPGGTNPVPVPNAQNGLCFGWSMDAVRYSSGQGYDLLLVSAPGYDKVGNGWEEGYAVLYDLKNYVKVWDKEGLDGCESNFGQCVRALGDLDGNGYEDFGVSDRYFEPPTITSYGGGEGGGIYAQTQHHYASMVCLFYRGSGGGVDREDDIYGTWKDSEEIVPTYFGSSFDSGDFNGDGYLDLVVGEPRATQVSSKVYIYRGSSTGIVLPYNGGGGPAAVIVQGAIDFGIEVSTIGDVNNDGMDDFLVGAPLYDYNGVTDNGRVYLYQGGPFNQIPGNNVWNLYGDGDPLKGSRQYLGGAREGFVWIGGGKSLWGMPSINGDANDDFLIGSPYVDSKKLGIPDVGYVRLYYG